MTTGKKVPKLNISNEMIPFLIADGDKKTAKVIEATNSHVVLGFRDGIQQRLEAGVGITKADIKLLGVSDTLVFTGATAVELIAHTPTKVELPKRASSAGSTRAFPR